MDDIAKMIRSNEEVIVIDNKTKNDITAATLTQIIFEAEKKASQFAPLFTLREIIQYGNGSISNYLAKLGAFPKDYQRVEPAKVVLPETAAEQKRASYDDVKQTLDARVGTAEKTTERNSSFDDEQTPDLPSSNRSLNG